jgi:probable F420-dependent oxidoreductase
MKLGVTTPVLTRLPRAHATWEDDNNFDAVVRIAVAAERFGYHHLTCSEHIAIPEPVAEVRGGRYWDPLSVFGFLAARTERLRFVTHVLVLGYHHPLEIVKRYGTLDRVSNGRLILGLGVGSLREEFDLIGAEFIERGARADDALRALRASLSERLPSYSGPYYHYEGFIVDPCALQPRVPFWIGGRTYRSLRRAVELGDGWDPFGLTLEEMDAHLRRVRDTEAWADREARVAAGEVPPFEMVLTPERPLDPIGDPAATAQTVAGFETAGTTTLNLRLRHHSLEHCLEQLEALAALVRSGGR